MVQQTTPNNSRGISISGQSDSGLWFTFARGRIRKESQQRLENLPEDKEYELKIMSPDLGGILEEHTKDWLLYELSRQHRP